MLTRPSFIFLSVSISLFSVPASAQSPTIQSAINAVSIDSLVLDVRKLSGELPVDVGNGPEFIFSRNDVNAGNQLASDWLQQRITSMLGTPVTQAFPPNGQNVLAYKWGAVHPERKVIICAHYDDMPASPSAAPAADDDGSGTCAVLEAMRVLLPYSFENTICFAMWDREEIGLLGSHYFAAGQASNDDSLVAVVNMDAIAYDGNGDRHMRVHTKPIANSIAIKDTALAVNTIYGINLPITVVNPGLSYSDHASFWSENYGAILIIENWEGDANPHYHTSSDLLQYLDQSYWADLAKLAIGTTAALAVPYQNTTVVEDRVAHRLDVSAYPNPTTGTTRVQWSVPGERTTISLYDALGNLQPTIAESLLPSGKQAFELDLRSLPPGAYVARLTIGDLQRAVRLVRMP